MKNRSTTWTQRTAWVATLMLLAWPLASQAGEKRFFGDIDFDEELEESYPPGSDTPVLDLKTDPEDNGSPVSIKVEAGAEGEGDEGYTLRVLKRGCEMGDPVANCPVQIEATSPGAGEPTTVVVDPLPSLVNRSNLGSWLEIEVEATAGAPTDMKLTVGPLESPPMPIGVPDCKLATLDAGKRHTWEFEIPPGQTGEIDIFLRDDGISPGKNKVELFDVDRVVSKAVLSKFGDVSLDNSQIDTLEITEDGTYHVIVSNTNSDGQGDYTLCVGPIPEPCTAIPLGDPATDDDLEVVADRDCFVLGPLEVGTEKLRFEFLETGSSDGTNEVLVVQTVDPQGDELLRKSLTGGTDINKMVTANAQGGEVYVIVANNLAGGDPDYTLKVTSEGACIGPLCELVPAGNVRVDVVSGGSADRPIQDGVDAASFEIDPSGSGTWGFEVLDNVSGSYCFTQSSGGGKFYVENCDLPNGLEPMKVKISGPNGKNALVRMGPDLGEAAKACVALTPTNDFGEAFSESQGGTVPDLVDGGDEDCYEFSLLAGQDTGVDFDNMGISDTKSACVYQVPAEDWRRDPNAQAEFCYTGTGDGSDAGGLLVASQTYQLVIDTSKFDDGRYDFCLGPNPAVDLDEAKELILPPAATFKTDGGTLDSCGDADTWTITNGDIASRVVEIEVREDQSLPGKIIATLFDEFGDPVDSGSSRTRVTLDAVLPGSGSYTLKVDHDKFTFGNYVIVVRVVE